MVRYRSKLYFFQNHIRFLGLVSSELEKKMNFIDFMDNHAIFVLKSRRFWSCQAENIKKQLALRLDLANFFVGALAEMADDIKTRKATELSEPAEKLSALLNMVIFVLFDSL